MKKLLTFASILLAGLFTLSCNGGKENGGNAGTPQLSVLVKDALDIFEVPERQTQTLNLYITADPVSEESYTITLSANPGLVATYNTAHGTGYQALPNEAYSFVSTQVTLPRYNPKSTSCELRLKGEGCVADQVYLLPVVIDGVTGGSNFQAPDDKAAYILFKMLPAVGDGSGTSADPYIIKDADDILNMNDLLQDDATTYFKMAADVDMKDVVFTNDKPWVPVNYAIDDETKPAARARKIVLDGDGHKISNFKADGPLFGNMCGGVKNLVLDNINIDSLVDDAAALIGDAGSSTSPDDFFLKDVTITGSKVESVGKRAGSLVSRMRNGVVENCVASCTVSVAQQGGGLIGRVDAGQLTNCSTSGDVTVDTYHGGGLVGFLLSGTVTKCHSTSTVTHVSGGNSRVGGLIGSICGSATVEKCYATGNVNGAGHWGGGLVGCIYDTLGGTVNVSECYATGTVTMPHADTGNQAHAGGLIGSVSPKSEATEITVVNISNCYATGAVITRRYSSGFLGSIYAAKAEVHIINGYTTSDISGIRVQERCGLVFGHGGSNLEEGKSTITCKGFVGWNTGDPAWRFSWGWEDAEHVFHDAFLVDGNYNGHQGTVSQQAQALGGWSTDIWDFSGNEPKLKNVK